MIKIDFVVFIGVADSELLAVNKSKREGTMTDETKKYINCCQRY